MNLSSKLVLQLFSLSSSLGLALAMLATMPAKADPAAIFQSEAKSTSIASTASCDASPNKADVDGIARKSTPENSLLDFSAAESDAAVILLGCDCLSCINTIRQLRNQSLLDRVQGHCWTALANRNSQQTIDQVLEAIDAAEANGPDAPLSWER